MYIIQSKENPVKQGFNLITTDYAISQTSFFVLLSTDLVTELHVAVKDQHDLPHVFSFPFRILEFSIPTNCIDEYGDDILVQYPALYKIVCL